MKKEDYKQALKRAEERLTKLLEQRAALDKRIAKLRQEIGSLAHLSGEPKPDPTYRLVADVKREMGLKGVCRQVLLASDEPLTPAEVILGIDRLGRQYEDYNSLLASVHTTLRRMAESGEAEESSKEGKKAYRLKV